MTTTTARALPRPRALSARWDLAALLVLAGVLELVNLSVNGYANDYYAAAVKSMSTSWHAFVFNSFDAAGVMTVDKPPLALWVQALFARVLGYHPVTLLLPQALMTVGSVALVHDLVRRRFGRAGGFVAGLVLALTPISVAMGRHNNPDALLVLFCVAALWFVGRALEDGRTRWVVWAGVMIGLGFETKMLAAFLVVPGMAAALLWVAPRGRRAMVRSLAAGGAALAVVGGAWPVLMWLTPASSRPWISGTADNSIWSLIFGYNGVGRLNGQAGGPGGLTGGNGGLAFGGTPGPFRLLHQSLGGQAGWLLGFAVVSAVALLAITRLRRTDPRTGWAIAVSGAFAACLAAFSFAQGIFHPYYVSQLAPFTAALVGAGAALSLRHAWIGAAALVAGALSEVAVIRQDATDLQWAIPVVLVAGGAAAAALVLYADRRVRATALAVGIAALLLAPASWAVQTTGHATGTTFPAGGPATSGGFPGGGGPFDGNSSALDTVVAYARSHGGGTIGVASQTGASAAVEKGEDVAGVGGFSGRESQVSVRWLDAAIRAGRIRWILADTGGFGGPQDARVGASDVMALAAQRGRRITVNGVTFYDMQGVRLAG